MILSFAILSAGLILLTIGAELLVRSASHLAVNFGISPLVVGLTVVAFGTSAPELVVSVQSVLNGQSDISIGNVVGSNILNVLFILGISAIIVPLRVKQELVKFDTIIMVTLSIIVYLFAKDGNIGRINGLFFVIGIISYTAFSIIKSKKESLEVIAEYEAEFGIKQNEKSSIKVLPNFIFFFVGLSLLIFGSQWFLNGAVSIAKDIGISELIIGLTIVAGGTSLPEVATSIVAAIKGERDIAVGNVVGSNIFNILGVLGVSSLISSNGIAVSETMLNIDIPVMVAVAALCLPIFFTQYTISRWEGVLFLSLYFIYTTSIILMATASSLAQEFNFYVLYFVIPITILLVLLSVLNALRTKHKSF